MGAMPPPPVGVLTVQPAPVALTTELTGRLEAWRTAQVRARASGIVLRRQFTEGSQVKAGQALYSLDAAPYQAAQAAAQASLAKADAAVAQAAAQLERNRPLAESRAISPQEWLATQTAHKQALADVAAAKAALQTATINLGYATITAPIAGRIGRSQVTEGALVGPADTTALATIQQTHPLYVNFTQSAADLLRLKKGADGKPAHTAAAPPVQVLLEDGSRYPLPGKLLFADSTVDPSTGQVSLRAELPNPDGLLMPGMFVKVQVQQSSVAQGVRVPQQAVTRGPAGDSVLVLGAGNVPQPRPVTVGAAQEGDWVITSGLAAGDKVVVDGVQKMRPGAPVTPVPWTPGAKPGAAPAAGAPASGPAAAAAGASAASGH